MTRSASPLRYPGGKAKLLNFMQSVVIANNLYGHVYREPFAGGGGLALSLLYSGFCSRISLNDADPAIAAFWRSVTRQPKDFCSKIAGVELSLDEWRRQKEIWSNKGASDFDLGFATFYLNRTNRSGIIEGAGPIGGYGQKGNYSIDARFNRLGLIKSVSQIGKSADRIEVTECDAVDYLHRHCDERSFVYLDPPYYVKGQRLYRNYYIHEDHLKVARCVKSLNCPWIVSYDNVEEIREIYNWGRSIEFTLQYSAAKSVRGEEVIFLGPNLDMDGVLSLAA